MGKKTSKQTGISISRKGYKFTASWRRGEKYTSQQFHYKINNGSWHAKSVSKTATKEDFTLSENDWNPKKSSKKVTKVAIKLTAKAKGDSKTSVTKVMKIKKPDKPKISVSEIGDNYVIYNISKPDGAENKPITRIDYEYTIVSDFNGTNNTSKYWKSGVTKDDFTNSSKDITVRFDGDILNNSKTAIIRARCRGIGGNSKFVYKNHVFANPYKPDIKKVKEKDVSIDKIAGTTTIKVGWEVDGGNKNHPIDLTTVQYLVGTPTINSEYVEASDVRDEVELTYHPDSRIRFSGYIPINAHISKLEILDDEGEEIPRDDIIFTRRNSPDAPSGYSEVNISIRGDYDATEGDLYWISSKYNWYVFDSETNLYTKATYDQLSNFDDDLTFYKYVKIFYPPQGTQPSDAVVQRDTKKTDYAVITLDMLIGLDQCIWVRVGAKHDDRISYSDYALAYKGKLAPPTITSISPPDTTTYKEIISVTNNSAVPNSFIALVYQDANNSKDAGKVIGIIPAGRTQSDPIQCPKFDGDITFGAFAICGGVNESATTKETIEGLPDPVTTYALSEDMKSDTIFNAEHIPVPPSDVEAVKLADKKGTIQVTWKNPWLEATGAEISWADHEDAWFSTSGPSSYTVDAVKEPKLNISDLATGKKWYICVRLYKITDNGGTIYGPPSNIEEVDLSEAPSIPILTVTPGNVVSVDRDIKASWTYVIEDDSKQASATLAELIEGQTEPVPLKQFETETLYHFTPQSIIDDETIDLDWSPGTTHDLVAKVFSTGQKESPWSNKVTITIAEPLICTISNTNLVRTVDGTQLDNPVLRDFPLNVTINGGDDNDVEAVMIKRFDDYPMERPDDSEYIGYNGEMICYKEADDDSNTVVIDRSDLEEYNTRFDDGAKYQIIASIQSKDAENNNEQLAVIPTADNTKIIPDPDNTDEMYEYFTVNWATQAIIPNDEEHPDWITAEIQYDEDAETDTPWKPGIGVIHIGNSPIQDDTAHLDIYRLSAGKPKLIYQNATFNTDYVDPYPTIGKRGGYRVVYITENGDYWTTDGPAWVDLEAYLDTKFQLIDFEDRTIEFKFNISFDNSWNKAFTLTHYLGGGIEGDWVEGVEHTHNIKGITIDDLDIEDGNLDDIRELAEYAGICHVRTIEGFNYTANINVGDSSDYNNPYHIHNISFDISEVDNPEFDGVTLAEWTEEEEEAE